MRSHAKASSAGSTQGRGGRSGSFVRGADATRGTSSRGTSSDADGSGAPSHRGRLVALSLAAALLSLALFTSSAFAAKELISSFGTFAESGSFGGELNNPRDVAVSGTGDAYVADEKNNRIERFDSNGNFVSAWGKDVIAPSINERQRIVLNEVAVAGTYTLSFEGFTTKPIEAQLGASTVEGALAALPTVGSGNVSVSGFGTADNPYIVTFKGALGGSNQPTISGDASELTGTISISTIINGKSSIANDTGTGFEVCTVATECKAGVASGGDGTASGNGSLSAPQSVAVDLDTGNVYVSDRGNRRIDEYDGAGNFIRSFGFDVAESGPGDTGTGYEVCNEAESDVCKAGVGGSGAGQFGEGFAENGFGIAVSPADGNASTGSVYLADSGNQRVGTYDLDGTSPASFGSSANFGPEQPRSVAVDSRGIVYASDSNENGDVLRYDSEDANGGGVGFLAPIVPPNNERQEITFTGFNSGDDFRFACPSGSLTGELTYIGGGNGLTIIKNGLEDACGTGNFSLSGELPNVTVTLQGALAASSQPQMTCTTLSGSGSCSVTTTSEGHPGPLLTGEASSTTAGLAVDPAGTVLYVLRDPSSGPTVVQQFGPTNEPGLSVAPAATDDAHGAAAGFGAVRGFGFDSTSGRFYVSATNVSGLTAAHRAYVIADSSALPNPAASMPFGAVTAIADRSATFSGTVDPNGGLVSCKFQYSTDEAHWADAGYAEGTGDVSGTTITNVKTTSGVFTVGQLIGGASIKAVKENTLILSFATLGNGTNVSLRATPPFPLRCDLLNLNGGSQSITQKVTGLAPGQKYFVRLQVTRPYFSSFAPVTSTVQSFTTASGPPALTEAKARTVDERSVRVTATIDPGHSPTSYVVQYGTTPSLGSSTAPVQIGDGSTPIEVSPVIGGLNPATQYYFKLLATNLTGPTASSGLAAATFPSSASFGSCPNDLLRTGPSAKLPDCRAYEQVTPTDKYGSDAYGSPYSVQASSSGDGITFFTFAGFPGGESLQQFNTFLSSFAGGQWSTAGMNPPPIYGERGTAKVWTGDLRISLATVFASTTISNALLLRDSIGGSVTVLVPHGVGFNANTFRLAGAFGSASKVVFHAGGNVPVTSGPAPLATARNVYLYDRETGEMTLAGVLPDSACGSPPCVPPSGSEAPAAFDGYIQDGNAVSTGGDIYFIDRATGQLYLRRDATGPSPITVEVAASERTESDPAGTFKPIFMGATPDGSHALFRSQQKLTDDSTATAGAEDLYRFNASAPAGQRLTDLAPGAEAVGVLGYSDSADYVYFAANADLDGAGPAAAGDCAGGAPEGFSTFSGACSAYLWQADGAGPCATAGGCIGFVARIDADEGDGFNWAGNKTIGGPSGGMKTSRVSADGQVLAFQSRYRLTAYDNQGVPQYYRYDAESGGIDCLTCDPTGAPPTGEPELKNPDMYHAPTSHSSFGAQPFLSRNLSADGNRFFFQTPEKLVPADVNGEVSCSNDNEVELGVGPSCLDVYMWEAPGTGSCTQGGTAYSTANDGCLYLLSTGTGAYPSYLADVSESGDTAFIFSRQQLVPSDEDTLHEIYAVKVNGGLAYQHATRPAPCEGDACRGPSSQPSDASGAGSAVFEGPGNPKSNTDSTRCPKGKRQVRSKGKVRCVAKQHGSKKQKRDRKRAANNNRRASR